MVRLLVVTMISRLGTTLLQATRGNHVCLPQVGAQKQKPQFDGTYNGMNLHI